MAHNTFIPSNQCTFRVSVKGFQVVSRRVLVVKTNTLAESFSLIPYAKLLVNFESHPTVCPIDWQGVKDVSP